MKTRTLIKWLSLMLIAVLALCQALPALACTAYYVGKETSADGSVMIGRISDMTDQYSPVHVVTFPRIENEPGRMLGNRALPDTTWKSVFLFRGQRLMGGVNEWGVTCSGPLTTYTGKASDIISEKIRRPEHQACDFDRFQYVLLTSRTADEAIHTLCALYDEYGCFDHNCTMIADAQEAWYFCPYPADQYCAVKLPDDSVAFYGNMPMLDAVDPGSPDVICSAELFSIPEQCGIAVYDGNGRMDLFRTYAGGALVDYSNLRTWRGHQLMAPSTAGEYDPNTKYPLAYQPDRKISVEELSGFLRDRYEGTEFCPDTTGRTDTRPIAYSHTVDAVILQTMPQLPAGLSGMMWTCMANTEFAPFVPISAASTRIPDAYLKGSESPREETASWRFKALYGFSVLNRARYGAGIKAYWEQEDSRRFSLMNEKLKEAADLYARDQAGAALMIDGICEEEMAKALKDGNDILSDLMLYIVNSDGERDWLSLNESIPAVVFSQPNIKPFQPFEKKAEGMSITVGKLTFSSIEEMTEFMNSLSPEELQEALYGTDE